VLRQLRGAQQADAVDLRATALFAELQAEVELLPKGVFNSALASTYEMLAYARALRELGASKEDIGTFFHESYEALVGRFPGWLRALARPFFRLLRPLLRRRLRREAQASQTDGLGSGWQLDWIDSGTDAQGKPDDLSFNVQSCAVCQLFARFELADVVPAICALDDTMSRHLGLGLRRSGTRALGDSCCDFRYRAGGEPRALSLRVID
jgi:hypothetical protein